MRTMARIALPLAFGVAALVVLLVIGAIGGVIAGMLVFVVSSPLWLTPAIVYPGVETLVATIAIGTGGFLGAAVALALFAHLIIRSQPVHGGQ